MAQQEAAAPSSLGGEPGASLGDRLMGLSGELVLPPGALERPVYLVVGEEAFRLSRSAVSTRLVVSRAAGVEKGACACSVADAATVAALASGALLPQVALATGKLKVTGDLAQLASLGPVFEGLLPPSSWSVPSFAARGDVVYYEIRGPAGMAAHRRFNEFRALRTALKRKAGVSARAAFPSRLLNVEAPERRRRTLEAWIQAVAAAAQAARPGKKAEAAARLIDAFGGASQGRRRDEEEKALLKEEVGFLRKRVGEPEALTCAVAASVTHRLSWLFATSLLAAGAAFVAVVAWARFGAAAAALAVLAWVAYARLNALHLHVTRLACMACCMTCWKVAKRFNRSTAEEAQQGAIFGLQGEGERSLVERLALRYLGEVLASLALSEKGLLVKLGQVFASMSGILAPEIVEPLSTLVDAMPPMAPGTRRRILARARVVDDDTTRHHHHHHHHHHHQHHERKHFLVIPDGALPVACASIAEVHNLRGEVALKVQKPGLRRQFAVELRSVRQLAALALVFEPTAPDLRATIDNASELHMRELDFVAEARALRHARRILAARSVDAVVPEPLDSVTGARSLKAGVLAMRWCQGVKMTKAERDALPERDLAQLATALVEAFACIVLVGGLINLDPHAGNVLIDRLPNDNGGGARPVLLDWGMHEFLADEVRLGICAVLRAVVDQDAAALQRALRSMGVISAFGAAVDLQQMTFLLRSSDAAPGADARTIRGFSRQLEANMDQAKKNAQHTGDRIVQGASVLNSFIRMIDLLHAYVADIPVKVDFIATFNKWAKVALDEEHQRQQQLAIAPPARR